MTLAGNAAETKPSILELCNIRMRNTQDSMAQRTNDFLSKSYIPALQRAGAKRVGAFTNSDRRRQSGDDPAERVSRCGHVGKLQPEIARR